MNDFDFDNIETTDEPTADAFDFDLVFGLEEPEFDKSILDEPVGDWEDDDGDPSFGVVVGNRPPEPGRDGGASLKPPKKQKKLELVA